MGTASKISKVKYQIQASGTSCNLKEVNLSHLGQIKRNKIELDVGECDKLE